jgi:hypothetical protein
MQSHDAMECHSLEKFKGKLQFWKFVFLLFAWFNGPSVVMKNCFTGLMRVHLERILNFFGDEILVSDDLFYFNK